MIHVYINGIYMSSQLFNYVYPGQEKVCVSSFFETTTAAAGVTSDTRAILMAGVWPLSRHSEHQDAFC